MPVINGLTNEYHPCQILADVFTCIEQRGSIEGKVVAWVGDGNNMAATWLQAADILGFTLHVSTPNGYEVDPPPPASSAATACASSAIRSTPAATPTSSPPTSGPAWATRPRTPSA